VTKDEYEKKEEDKYLPDFSIRMGPKRINVRSDSSSEKSRLLRDDAKFGPEIPEPNGADVPAVNQDSPIGGVYQPKESAQKCRLPTTCPPHYPNLIPCTESACDSF
jgi:hypothetical protein